MSSPLISATQVRQNLINTGFYLGDPTTADRVRWAPNGRKNVLFANTASSSEDEPHVALLSAIVVISQQGFFLTSDANWRGPTAISPGLADAKGACSGVSPQVNPFRNDFTAAVEHARLLENQVAAHGEDARMGFVRNNCLKFRHVFFEKITEDESMEGTVSLDDWPVHSENAAVALERMKATYRAVPLAAYDLNNRLIEPAYYEQQLQGALVEIHFTLSHSAFRAKDTFTADIHTIHVLRAPHTVSTTTKRNLPSTFERPGSSNCFVQVGRISPSWPTIHVVPFPLPGFLSSRACYVPSCFLGYGCGYYKHALLRIAFNFQFFYSDDVCSTYRLASQLRQLHHENDNEENQPSLE